MKEYVGVKYEEKRPGLWRVVWPSRLVGLVEAPDEGALHEKIDAATEGE